MQIEDIWVRYCLKNSTDIVVFYHDSGVISNFFITIYEETFNLQIIEAEINLKIAIIQKKDTDKVELTIQTK